MARIAYHHGDLRNALIEAGQSILEDQGIEALSLRATARKAGVSQTAPYRHFDDKEALLAAIATEGFRSFGEALAHAMDDPSGGSASGLGPMGQAYVHFALDNPALFGLMFGGPIEDKSKYPDLNMASLSSFQQLQNAVSARLGPAERADGRTVAMAALTTWSLVHGLATLLLNKGGLPPVFCDMDPSEIIRQVTGSDGAGPANLMID